MIKVVAKNYIKADCVDEAIRLSGVLVGETRKEEGCIRYELYQDVDNESILTMIEEWVSKEALDAHMASDHVKCIFPQFGPLVEKETEINVYQNVL